MNELITLDPRALGGTQLDPVAIKVRAVPPDVYLAQPESIVIQILFATNDRIRINLVDDKTIQIGAYYIMLVNTTMFKEELYNYIEENGINSQEFIIASYGTVQSKKTGKDIFVFRIFSA